MCLNIPNFALSDLANGCLISLEVMWTMDVNLSLHLFIAVICEIVLHYSAFSFSNINLPKNHVKYYFNAFKEVSEKCLEDETCPFKVMNLYWLNPNQFYYFAKIL